MRLEDFKRLNRIQQTERLKKLNKTLGKCVPTTGNKTSKAARYKKILEEYPQLSNETENVDKQVTSDQLQRSEAQGATPVEPLTITSNPVSPITASCLKALEWPQSYENVGDNTGVELFLYNTEDMMHLVARVIDETKPSWQAANNWGQLTTTIRESMEALGTWTFPKEAEGLLLSLGVNLGENGIISAETPAELHDVLLAEVRIITTALRRRLLMWHQTFPAVPVSHAICPQHFNDLEKAAVRKFCRAKLRETEGVLKKDFTDEAMDHFIEQLTGSSDFPISRAKTARVVKRVVTDERKVLMKTCAKKSKAGEVEELEREVTPENEPEQPIDLVVTRRRRMHEPGSLIDPVEAFIPDEDDVEWQL